MCSPPQASTLVDEIAELAAHLDASHQKLLAMVRQADQEKVWAQYGLASCEAFLGWRIGLGRREASELVRVARALGGLPLIDAAMRDGTLSYSKVRMLTRVAAAGDEAGLVQVAKAATAAQLQRICAAVRRLADEAPDERPLRWVRVDKTSDGLARLTAQLLPDEAALVMAAIEAAREPETTETSESGSSESPESSRPSRADGLVRVADAFLAGDRPGRCGGERQQLYIHLKPSVIASNDDRYDAVLEDGTALSAETLRRIACDAGLVPISVDDEGRPLDVGRKSRTIPGAIRRALRVRDPVCQFPGCTNSRFVDVHHIVPWGQGGRTSLDNLLRLCCAHHHLVHEGGYSVAREPSGALSFTGPHGENLQARPPPATVHRAPPTWLKEQLAADGLTIESDANFVWWDGTRVDLNAAVGCATGG